MAKSLIVTGKVVDDAGFGIAGATISEIPLQEGATVSADVVTGPDGSYTMQVMDSNSKLLFEAEDYQSLLYPAAAVPANVGLSFEGVIISAKTVEKPDNTLKWVGFGIGALLLINYLSSSDKTKKASGTLKGPKKEYKAKMVVV